MLLEAFAGNFYCLSVQISHSGSFRFSPVVRPVFIGLVVGNENPCQDECATRIRHQRHRLMEEEGTRYHSGDGVQIDIVAGGQGTDFLHCDTPPQEAQEGSHDSKEHEVRPDRW